MQLLRFFRVLSLAFFSLFVCGNEIVSAHNYYGNVDDYEKIRNRERFLPRALLCGVCLDCFNLDDVYLRGSFLSFANFKETSFVNANLEDCYLSEANFKDANLTNATLDGSILLNANFEKAKVFRTDFKNTIGLTNAQKEILRKNGAINVPVDLSKEEFEQELKLIEEWKKQFTFWGQLKNLCSRLFCCCRKK